MNQTPYREQSKVFLAQAAEELARGDLHQASEKGWGAAAQMVKAVATARDWEHNSHSGLYRVVGRLVEETHEESLRTQFAVAGFLHTNYYEGWLGQEDIEGHLGQVAVFVERMEALLDQG